VGLPLMNRIIPALLTAALLAACNLDQGGSSASGAANGAAVAVASGAHPLTAPSAPGRLSLSTLLSGIATGNAGVSGEPSADQLKPASPADAARFLAQATMGASESDIAQLQSLGYTAWFDRQLGAPQQSHRAYVEAAVRTAGVPSDANLGTEVIADSFYKQAATGQDQLRQRVAWALSQVFVTTMADNWFNFYFKRGIASYMDTLKRDAFAPYGTVLQDVTVHPMIANYLSWMSNQKEDPATNRWPDQNFAREVMQLFSIGLVQLNIDGTPRLNNGQEIDTYGQSDIVGLSKVFTGFAWSGPDTNPLRFFGFTGYLDPNRDITPVQPYPDYHSTGEKRFLGVVIPAQQIPDPAGDLKIALNTLAAHPNVGPFIGKQLIKHLVTSNPSPAYVARVAQAFNSGRYTLGTWSTGSGQRGDLGATVAAILLDSEARDPSYIADPTFGRVREPVLRLTAWMRAFGAQSTSGSYLIGNTDNAAGQLDMTPGMEPTVFNFYNPEYAPPGSSLANAGLVAPALQLVNATTAVGYTNFMHQIATGGWGDVNASYAKEMAVASDPQALVARVNLLLASGTLCASTQAAIETAVSSVPVDPSAPSVAYLRRAWIAVTFALGSPDFIVQR
jgi:uncharacterized protein (DUF1800 family)